MAYDPIRDRITPTSSPYNPTTFLPGQSVGGPHQTPINQPRRPSSSGYGGVGFSTPVGNGPSTAPHTHHGDGGGQTYLSPNVTTPYNDLRAIDRSYFSLPIRDHHPSLSAPLQIRNGSLSPIPPNGYGHNRELPTLAYPPAFSHPTNLGSTEMTRNISSGSGGGNRSISSGSNGSGFTPGGERGNGNGAGPGGPGLRSILNDQLPQPPIRHPESRRSSFGVMGTSPLSGPSALPGQGRYTHGERSTTPLESRDRDSTTPTGMSQLVTPSRTNSISLSMLLNDDSASIKEGKRNSFGGGGGGGRPTSSSSSLGGMGSDVVVQQVGGLDSLADAALALESTRSKESSRLNGNASGNGAINGLPKRARSRSNSPRFPNGSSNANGREVMSPTADTPSASTDDMELQRPSSSSGTTLRRGSFHLPTSIPGAGAVTVDPAALEKWQKEKAKKKGLGKPRKESMVSPQGEVVPKSAEKSKGKRKSVAVLQETDGKPKDIDLTFSPEATAIDLGTVMSPAEEPAPRKKSRKESFTSSAPSRRESMTNESAASPSEELKNGREEERWSPSAPSASLIATDNAVKQAMSSRKVSGLTAAQQRAREEVSPTSELSLKPLGQTPSDGFAVPHVPVERKPSQPSRETPPPPSSRPRGIPYNPTHRVSRPIHMLKAISPDEIAWLRQQRRNPLARVSITTPVNGNGRRESGDPAPRDRVLSADAGSSKRRRDSDASVTEERRRSADAGIVVKRQRDEEGNARVVSNQYENHHVAAHYNSRKDLGKNAREHSAIFGLRKFNNWVKSVLIHRFACCRPESEGRDARGRPRPGRVLDMGCGKGGDLKKWDKAYIADYIGVDIAAGSIADAKARAASDHLRYNAKFYVLDCFNEPVKKVLSDEEVAPLFDNVSMQFCIHYAFSDVGRVRLMLENASRYLRKGGVFFGTTLSDHKILQKLAEIPSDKDLVIQNDYYRIVFDEREHKGPFGHAYTFTLLDAIDECKEYVVTWSEFESLAREYGFTCVYRKDFDELFEEEHDVPGSYALAEKMGVTRGGNMFMNPGEWEAATMYMAFAFEQTREPKRRL